MQSCRRRCKQPGSGSRLSRAAAVDLSLEKAGGGLLGNFGKISGKELLRIRSIAFFAEGSLCSREDVPRIPSAVIMMQSSGVSDSTQRGQGRVSLQRSCFALHGWQPAGWAGSRGRTGRGSLKTCDPGGVVGRSKMDGVALLRALCSIPSQARVEPCTPRCHSSRNPLDYACL